MQLKPHVLSTAITSLLAVGTLISSNVTQAAQDNREQCAGVVKAGKNDCATSKNACHGHVKTSSDSEAWIYVPRGTCERIVGARLVKVKDPTPAKIRTKAGAL